MSPSDPHIPTLDEVIFHGQEKSENQGETSKSTQPPVRANSDTQENNSPKQSNFEQQINLCVDRILEKHMRAAREEIIQTVMQELRSRLPAAARKRPG